VLRSANFTLPDKVRYISSAQVFGMRKLEVVAAERVAAGGTPPPKAKNDDS
jgi:hypothetical protein